MHHLETERLYNIPYGQSSRKLKLARAEPSKLTTSSGKALEINLQLARAEPSKLTTSSGKALEINLQLARAEPSKHTTSSGRALETYN